MKKTHLRDAPSEAATSEDGGSDTSRASRAATEAQEAANLKESSAKSASAAQEFHVEDSKTGLRTRWKISPPQQYIDPTTRQSRSLTLKHFPKEGNDAGGKRRKGQSFQIFHGASKADEHKGTPGRLREARHSET